MSGTKQIKVRFQDLGKFERILGEEFRSKKAAALAAYGREIVVYLGLSSMHIRDLGNFSNSWKFETRARGISFFNSQPYERWVEAGRRPGKMPPRSKIEPWVIRHFGDARLTFPIMRKIGLEGTKGRPVLTSARVQAHMSATFSAMTQRLWDTAMDMAARRAY
jgi:hypothetical protein